MRKLVSCTDAQLACVLQRTRSELAGLTAAGRAAPLSTGEATAGPTTSTATAGDSCRCEARLFFSLFPALHPDEASKK